MFECALWRKLQRVGVSSVRHGAEGWPDSRRGPRDARGRRGSHRARSSQRREKKERGKKGSLTQRRRGRREEKKKQVPRFARNDTVAVAASGRERAGLPTRSEQVGAG